MSSWQIIAFVIVILVGMPVMSYLVMKFGATGYFRAKRRWRDKTKETE